MRFLKNHIELKKVPASNSFQKISIWGITLLLMFSFAGRKSYAQEVEPVKVGTKLFTESVIIGEISYQMLQEEGFETQFYKQLGGTRILWNALLSGEIDIYPDYTGTIIQEMLGGADIKTIAELNKKLAELGLQSTESLGFNNTYALGMLKAKADKLGINSISDLRNHPELKFGFSNEFIDRADGWAGLKSAYRLAPKTVTGLDHDLAYRGLQGNDIDIIDLYSTDAEIDYYNLKVLKDDQQFFPDYQAIILYRKDLESTNAKAVQVLKRLEGRVNEDVMVAMNADVKIREKSDAAVASSYLEQTFGFKTEVKESTLWSRLWVNTLGHFYLVGISLGLAILVAIPLGVVAAKVSGIESVVLNVVGVLQTIPSLALLVFMIPLLGIGAVPAMAALFLYSLLPIVRNTHSGIKNIPMPIIESAQALGLPNTVILKKIELPLALPTILTGIKTSAVINVGTATLGALIGAGGYGQPILTGIRLDSVSLILEGAIPAAVLALLVQGFFDLVERVMRR